MRRVRRTTTLTAAGLLGLALLAPTTAATAAETCRGEAATIVGTGPTLTGTEGRDVIVSGPATSVFALGGNDLICVTGSGSPSVDAGTGDDVVDTTGIASAAGVTTVLGAGADTFVGGRSEDAVHAGHRSDSSTNAPDPGSDSEADRVDTGEGDDAVFTGSAGAANHDVVTLGTGTDYLFVGSSAVAADAVLDGADGVDALRLATGDSDVSLDLELGTLTTSLGASRLTSFESTNLLTGTGRITYQGTAGNDHLEVHPQSGPTPLDIATAAGQDEIVVEPADIAAGSRINGGEGRNGLVAPSRTGSMALDLEQGVLVVDGRSSTVAGLQDAFLMAPEVTMVGNDRGNNLTFAGCRGDLRGGAGRDRLRNAYDYYYEFYTFDCRARTVMVGGPAADHLRGGQGGDRLFGGSGSDEINGRGGNDRILGDEAADTLVGGRGRDFADGSTGHDRCVAERERRCER